MAVEIFNTSTKQIVEVPDDAADAYLAQTTYRKVKPTDRVPEEPDTVSRAEFTALFNAVTVLAQDVATLKTAQQPKDPV